MGPRLRLVAGTASLRTRLNRANATLKQDEVSKAMQEGMRQVDGLLTQAEQLIEMAQDMLGHIAEHGRARSQ